MSGHDSDDDDDTAHAPDRRTLHQGPQHPHDTEPRDLPPLPSSSGGLSSTPLAAARDLPIPVRSKRRIRPARRMMSVAPHPQTLSSSSNTLIFADSAAKLSRPRAGAVVFADPADNLPYPVGQYSVGQRRAKVQRYLAKRRRRLAAAAQPRGPYEQRARFALTRPRIGGRFISLNGAAGQRALAEYDELQQAVVPVPVSMAAIFLAEEDAARRRLR